MISARDRALAARWAAEERAAGRLVSTQMESRVAGALTRGGAWRLGSEEAWRRLRIWSESQNLDRRRPPTQVLAHLYFDLVPVIMLNGTDATRGRLFSLLHEYAHLLLHTEGLCDTTTDTRATSPDRALEARCNALAAAMLMPEQAILTSPLVKEHPAGQPWSLPELIEAAQPFGVSAEAFLRRLVTLGKVPLKHYQEFREGRDSPVVRSRSGRGNFYYTKARDLGKGYVRRVAGAHRRALIDSNTAATYLDVKVGQIAKLAEVSQV